MFCLFPPEVTSRLSAMSTISLSSTNRLEFLNVCQILRSAGRPFQCDEVVQRCDSDTVSPTTDFWDRASSSSNGTSASTAHRPHAMGLTGSTSCIQDFEYWFVDGHRAILANTRRNTSCPDIGRKEAASFGLYLNSAATMLKRSWLISQPADTD